MRARPISLRSRAPERTRTPGPFEDALIEALRRAWLDDRHPIRIAFCLELARWAEASVKASRSPIRVGRFPDGKVRGGHHG
jgi:hypothetical protein